MDRAEKVCFWARELLGPGLFIVAVAMALSTMYCITRYEPSKRDYEPSLRARAAADIDTLDISAASDAVRRSDVVAYTPWADPVTASRPNVKPDERIAAALERQAQAMEALQFMLARSLDITQAQMAKEEKRGFWNRWFDGLSESWEARSKKKANKANKATLAPSDVNLGDTRPSPKPTQSTR